MNAKLNFASPSSTLAVAAAALATVIAMGILWAVVALFQSRGAPMERLAAADRGQDLRMRVRRPLPHRTRPLPGGASGDRAGGAGARLPLLLSRGGPADPAS